MKVDAIKSLIADFKSQQLEIQVPSNYWEMITKFQEKWNLQLEDKELEIMFNQSIHSSKDRSIWKRERYRPKELMALCFKHYPDYSRQAFKELFDDNIDLEIRIDRFKFYSEQLLNLYKKDHPGSTENNHYQDTEIISFYLFLNNPEKYPLYKFKWLRNICELTGARPIPKNDDIMRFQKIAGILKKFLSQNQDLEDHYKFQIQRFKLNFCKPLETFIPVADFCAYCATKSSHLIV